MSNKNSKSPKNKENKGISVVALIVCFFIACGIWLYAQAIDDDINVKTFNQLQVEFEGAEAFKENVGYEVGSLAVQNANISISGTNRELVKYDAQSIRLIADVGAANNGVATIRAYVFDENGERSEVKNYQVTPAVVAVNVIKEIEFSVKDVTVEPNTKDFTYDLSCETEKLTITGPVTDVSMISSANFEIDYHSITASRDYSGFTVSFYDAEGNLLYNDTNKNENVKYDTTNIVVKLTVTPKDTQNE